MAAIFKFKMAAISDDLISENFWYVDLQTKYYGKSHLNQISVTSLTPDKSRQF